ncbi:hypothetical protein M1E17_17510 [Arthrobacter sp. D1-29]
MARNSGFDDLIKDLGKLVDNASKLDGLTVSIAATDTVADVEKKLRAEASRRGVTNLSASELRGMAQDMHWSARR